LVDPGEAVPALNFLAKRKLSLVAILVSHHHWDHTDGIADILAYAKVPVIGAANSRLSYLTQHMQDNETFVLEKLVQSFTVLAIPGHTFDHIAFYAPGILFCGDTLFAAGCGRAFEGTPQQLYQSLQKLAALPDRTKVFCAHEYTQSNLRFAAMVEPENATIQERIVAVNKLRAEGASTLPSVLSLEKNTNPFLRCHVPSVVKAAETHAGKKLEGPAAVFTVLREWKNHF
jgi:hydroxyacylglutathione hydrolase